MESVIHPLIVCIRVLRQHKLTCGIEAGCPADFEAYVCMYCNYRTRVYVIPYRIFGRTSTIRERYYSSYIVGLHSM
jgi:hypothetical protein